MFLICPKMSRHEHSHHLKMWKQYFILMFVVSVCIISDIFENCKLDYVLWKQQSLTCHFSLRLSYFIFARQTWLTSKFYCNFWCTKHVFKSIVTYTILLSNFIAVVLYTFYWPHKEYKSFVIQVADLLR